MFSKTISSVRKFSSRALVVLISTLLVVAVAEGATTISTNIDTGGTLGVTGLAHFTDDIKVYGGDINLGIGTATTTLTYNSSAATLGITTGVDIYGSVIRLGSGAATTSITTLSGTLTSLSGDLDIYGGDLSIGTGLATTTLKTAAQNIGISTTSPFARVSISATSTSALSSVPLFAVSTSTASASSTAFIVNADGRVGVRTSAPTAGASFEVAGNASSTGLIVGGQPTNGTITSILFGTCAVDIPSMTASTTAVATCTATGVTTSHQVFVTPGTLPAEIVFTSASTTAANTISVGLYNIGSPTGTIDPPEKTWAWFAIK